MGEQVGSPGKAKDDVWITKEELWDLVTICLDTLAFQNSGPFSMNYETRYKLATDIINRGGAPRRITGRCSKGVKK